jgi:hypothetical protein
LRPVSGLLLVFVVLLAGCGTLKQVKQFKEAAAAGKYQELAASEVSCKPRSDGCNQLHLIKGDACFRLAKQGVNPEKHYTCAVQHLDLGIEQTRTWERGDLNLDRAQTYENLVESLRNLQDIQRGEQARATGAQFLKVAETFERKEPKHLGAIYLAAKARMRELQPQLLRITTENRAALCRRLKTIHAPIARVLADAPAEYWSRYEQNYRQLDRELALAQRLVPNCS